ncbi:hypothetical protein BDN71DRAFT_1479626 [Pleurotus eryngii]|uniref:AA9 family lytic polysaccharide monooxygenase n=1 Tax=Pleurotus eryngii TaxID=5323 RepID=A0A9P6DE47_PLEER|nr:hypothetical protein BDN71DRAFT_1479626 [Pleurotus eryngii]
MQVACHGGVYNIVSALASVSNISHREWDMYTYNPITDPLDQNIACNVDGSLDGYTAKCPVSCTSATASSLSWAGLLSGTLSAGSLTQGKLVNNANTWTTTIPASLFPGEYMTRRELLAIHTSTRFYPECAQLILTGNGSAQPSGSYLVKFPGAYQRYVEAQASTTNYTIPGSAVWRG